MIPAETSQVPTRGERNNNPGNILRDATPWLGMVPEDERRDDRFCEFDTPLHGIRALCRVLLSYQRLDGCRTPAQIIARYAPGPENDTDAYLRDVVARTGIGAGETVNLEDEGQLINLARAIIWHENGRCVYGDALIAAAARLALQR
jgi:hypothetical protein